MTQHKGTKFRVIGIGCEYCEKEISHRNCLFPGKKIKEPRKDKKAETRKQQNLAKHVSKMYTCDARPYESLRKQNVTFHQKVNHKNEDCGVLYDGAKVGDLRRVRKKQISNGGKYKCNICEYRYNQKPVVRLHQQKHHKDKDCIIFGIGCELCKEELPHNKCKFSANTLKTKSLKPIEEYQISCKQCPAKILKSFAKKHVEASHLGYVNFSCGKCTYKSYYKHHVKLHQKGVHKNIDVILIDTIDCIYCRKIEAHDECKIVKRVTRNVRRTQHLTKSGSATKKRFSCDQCTYKTYFKYKLFTHIKNDHGQSDDGSFNLDDGELTKIATQESSGMFHCKECDFQTEREDTLRNHTNNVHLAVKRFSCSHCDYKSYYRNLLKYHLKRQHEDSEQRVLVIGCIKCESGEKHELCTNGEVTFQMRRKKDQQKIAKENCCRICKLISINKAKMIKHFKIQHTGEFVFTCDLCKYQSNWISNLNNHKSSIHEKNIFSCDLCDFTSKWKGPLFEHRREKHKIFMKKSKLSESGLGETLCDLCGFSASTLKYLHLHTKRQHTDSPTILKSLTKCNKCDYSTPYPANMKVHRQAKHEDLRYPCLQCAYTATTEVNLRVHTRYIHTLGQNYLKCKVCSYATTFPGNLKTHTKGKHSTR